MIYVSTYSSVFFVWKTQHIVLRSSESRHVNGKISYLPALQEVRIRWNLLWFAWNSCPQQMTFETSAFESGYSVKYFDQSAKSTIKQKLYYYYYPQQKSQVSALDHCQLLKFA